MLMFDNFLIHVSRLTMIRGRVQKAIDMAVVFKPQPPSHFPISFHDIRIIIILWKTIFKSARMNFKYNLILKLNPLLVRRNIWQTNTKYE